MLGRVNSGADYIKKGEARVRRSVTAVREVARLKTEELIRPTTITPEMAVELLEHNTKNRPLSDQHVHRIARQVTEGKWRFNGDTIKIATTGDVLDGQHRLWACIEAKKPIETIIVRGIEPEAFATIDTLRKARSGADVLSLAGASRYRPALSAALGWLLRWQRGVLPEYRAPQNRIENSDIEDAYAAHPGMTNAVERASKLRSIANPGVLGFVYYVVSNRSSEIGDALMSTLEDPAAVSINDPFFRLRVYFTSDHHRTKDPLMTIALCVKAANAAHAKKKINVLSWRVQGKATEEFPVLEI